MPAAATSRIRCDRRGEKNQLKRLFAPLPYGGTTMKITKDTLIGDALQIDVELAQFFFEIGMHCLGCPSARGESLEMACAVHGVDVEQMVADINAYLASK